MDLKSFLKILGVALAGTTVNTVAPMAASIPSKYTPAVTAGLLGLAYAMQSPRKDDNGQNALLQQVLQTQAAIQQHLLMYLPTVPAAAAIAPPAPPLAQVGLGQASQQ